MILGTSSGFLTYLVDVVDFVDMQSSSISLPALVVKVLLLFLPAVLTEVDDCAKSFPFVDIVFLV